MTFLFFARPEVELIIYKNDVGILEVADFDRRKNVDRSSGIYSDFRERQIDMSSAKILHSRVRRIKFGSRSILISRVRPESRFAGLN